MVKSKIALFACIRVTNNVHRDINLYNGGGLGYVPEHTISYNTGLCEHCLSDTSLEGSSVWEATFADPSDSCGQWQAVNTTLLCKKLVKTSPSTLSLALLFLWVQ